MSAAEKIEENKKSVETMWQALSAMDREALKGCLAEDIHDEDVPTEDPGARGPENVVFLEHTEVWTFKSGEKATNPFATMHEMKDGKITKWSDYWDVSGFVAQFPQWFLEEMAKGSEADFSD